MNEQSHIVSGIYTTRGEAEAVLERLVERGVPRGEMYIVDHPAIPETPKMASDNEALRDMVVNGSIGAAVGTGIGALAEVALVAANVTLFVASPLIAPLAMLGWGAALGGAVGVAIGTDKKEKRKEGMFSELVLDVIKNGHVVLVANTWTEEEAAVVREVIGDSIAQET